MNPKPINHLGMELHEWNHKSCMATVGYDTDWSTIYSMRSGDKGNGHGSELLLQMKKYYTQRGMEFGSTVAISKAMKHILDKHGIPEYN